MPGEMFLRIWDVEHGACAMLHHEIDGRAGRLAMIDSGDTESWEPSTFVRSTLNRSALDYLFITNADQDHMSDLSSFARIGVAVTAFYRNPTLTPTILRGIKLASGVLSEDAQRYIEMSQSHIEAVQAPFNASMGGITSSQFWNSYPTFTDTNNLSMAVFFKYGPFKILFPGDLEAPGWDALVQRSDFRNELLNLTVLVASHHGRESGYCEELFTHCQPQCIVMSDKAIVHDTQRMTETYRERVKASHPEGVFVTTSGRHRHVLTTRKDGWIQFKVFENGSFNIDTEYVG